MSSFPLVSNQIASTELAQLKLEMDLARRVQLSLLPKIPPSIPGLDLSGFFRPASHVGGDFYDFIVGADQSLTFFIGDVSGKGMAAAMLMTMTRAILRAEIFSSLVATPESILKNANAKLLDDFVQAGMFVTVFVGQYHPASQELIFANAGHSAVFHRPVNGQAELLEADGTPLGIQENTFSESHRLCLDEGALLVLTTDGLYEASNSRGEIFGVDRLLEQVQRFDRQSAIEISNVLLKTVEHFTDCDSQADDQTIMVVRRTA